MKTQDGAEEDAPHQKGPSAKEQEGATEDRHGNPMPFADPDVEPVFAKVRDEGKKDRRVIVNALTGEDPADMGPEAAVLRRMGVAFFVRVLVMHTMDSDPEDGAALQGQRAAYGEKIFHPFRRLVASMGQEPMVAHADADAASDPPQGDRYEERFPREEKQSGDRSEMKDDHEECRHPDDRLRKGSVVP